jgi:hypothetical protein
VEEVPSQIVQRHRPDESFFRKSFRHVNNDSDSSDFSIRLFSESSIHIPGIFIQNLSEYPIHIARSPHSDCDKLMLRFYHIAGRIQHPSRYFKRSCLGVLADATGKHDRPAPVPLSVDRYLLSVERMPRVNYFGRIGFMGFVSLGCITASGPTAAWVTARLTSSPKC